MVEALISVNNLAYSYPDGTIALKDLNLQVNAGESIALVGPNGAGKSTLLQLLAGLIPAKVGTIHIDGKTIDKKAVESAHDLIWLRRKLGMVFQDSDVSLFNSTVWGDVTFGPLHMGWSKEEVVSKSQKALDSLGIGNLKGRAPYRLSGGEKRKVSIACILATDPEIILFDEPTSDLDPKSRKVVIQIIKELSNSGKTIIVATHDVNAVPEFARRIVVLNKRVVADGDMRKIITDEKMLETADVDVPEVTRLFRMLAEHGYRTDSLPINVEEAVHSILHKKGDAPHTHQ